MPTDDMILPDDFEMPEGSAGGGPGTTESGNEPAKPEAGLTLPGGQGGGNTTPNAGGQPGTIGVPGTGGAPDGRAPDGTSPNSGGAPKGAPGTENGAEGQKQAPASFKVKYNHEERELGYDEAVPLIQKGMNYDKLQERAAALQNDPRPGRYDKVMEVAKLLGYQTDEALLDTMLNTYYTNVAAEKNLTVDQVKKDLEQSTRDAELKRRESALNQKEQNEARTRAENAMYERFLNVFPDVKPADIKPETWARVKQGVDLTAAFVEQRNQDLESQVKTMKQNMKNAKSAPVGSVTEHGSAEPGAQDPFLMGFDSVK